MKYTLMCAVGLALAACGSSGSIDVPVPAELTRLVSPGGDLFSDYDTPGSNESTVRPGVGTFDLTTGTIDGVQAGRASWAVSSSIAAAPTSDATLNGSFSLYEVGTTDSIASGSASLAFDVSEQTLTGTFGGVTLAGTVAGNDISGTATYNGINGFVGGAISINGAVGAFAGDNGTDGFVGGFSVN